jgi:hypothetical protein
MNKVSKRQIRAWFNEAGSHVPIVPTKLFNIAPRGLNTNQVQSLGNYCEQLVFAHSAAPARYFKVLSHNLYYKLGPSRLSLLEKKNNSKSVVEELQILTGRNDIRHCSLNWMDFLIIRRWTSSKTRFCRQCIDDDAEKFNLPYERLIWKLNSIKICPVHKVPLQTLGPCSKPKSVRTIHARLFGVCSNCDSIGYHCQFDQVRRVSAADALLSEQWAEVIQQAQTSDFTLSGVREGIAQLGMQYAKRAQLARACNLTNWQLQGIEQYNNNRFSVCYLENIAMGSGATLLQLLSATVPPTIPKHLPRYRQRPASPNSEVIRLLTAIVSSPSGTISQAMAESRRPRSYLRKLDCALVERLESREIESELASRFSNFRVLCHDVEKQVILAIQSGRPVTIYYLRLQSGHYYPPRSYRTLFLRLILRKLTCRALPIDMFSRSAISMAENFIDASVANIREQVTIEQLAIAELAYHRFPRLPSKEG